MKPRLPVTIIGGYLGAGKTTLINHLLRHNDGHRLAVLVNEFGALQIDEDLIVEKGDSVIALAGGCVCCSFGDDLSGALMDLSALDPAPDQVLIEASGVALPSGIAGSVSILPGFELGAIVVLADSETIRDQAGAPYIGDTILRQLQAADIVVLTKTDLVTDTDLAATRNWLEITAEHARIVPAIQGQIAIQLLLGPRRTTPSDPSGAGHADALFDSIVLSPDHPVDPHVLARRIIGGDLGVVRAKGFVTAPDGRAFTIQIVGQRADVFAGDDPGYTGVVCIGLKGTLKADALRQLMVKSAETAG